MKHEWLRLNGRVAFIAGGGSGIGRATAFALAEAGASVMVADYDSRAADAVVAQIHSDGGTADSLSVDVSNFAQMDTAVARTVERFGALHLGVNCAAVKSKPSKIGQLDFTDWNRVIDVDLTGVMIGLDRQLPAIDASGGGAVVNIASIAGLQGVTNNVAYAASKHAIIGVTRSAALEWGGAGIRINAVCPGYVNTPLTAAIGSDYREATSSRTALGRFGEPEEMADVISFLLSPRSSFVTGSVYVADGGFTAGYRGALS